MKPLCISLNQYKSTNQPPKSMENLTDKQWDYDDWVHTFGHDTSRLYIFTDGLLNDFVINGWTFTSQYKMDSYEGVRRGNCISWDLRITGQCLSPKNEIVTLKIRTMRFWGKEDSCDYNMAEVLMNTILTISICEDKNDYDSIAGVLSIYPWLIPSKEQLEELVNYKELIDKYEKKHNHDDFTLAYVKMDLNRRVCWAKEMLSQDELLHMYCPWYDY